jgi:hypothetical protein
MNKYKTQESLNRENEMIKLYELGTSFREIGEQFGISKQRVWQILKLKWGDYDNRNHKISNVCNNTPSELYVFGRFSVLGFKFTPMPYNHSFDVVVEGKRVEIKYKSRPSHQIIRGCVQNKYKFNYLKDKVNVDFYIFVCGELNHNPKCYIYRGDEVGMTLGIPEKFIYKAYENRYNKHLENWDQIKSISPIDIDTKVK